MRGEAAQADDAMDVAVFILNRCEAFGVLIDDMSAFAGVRIKRNYVWCDTKANIKRIEFHTMTDEFGDWVACCVYTKDTLTKRKDLHPLILCESASVGPKRLQV